MRKAANYRPKRSLIQVRADQVANVPETAQTLNVVTLGYRRHSPYAAAMTHERGCRTTVCRSSLQLRSVLTLGNAKKPNHTSLWCVSLGFVLLTGAPIHVHAASCMASRTISLLSGAEKGLHTGRLGKYTRLL